MRGLGVVTGKGLSDLIREEFGFRPTFFVMVTGFLVDLANVVAEFAGIAAAMEIFGVSKYISVPTAGIVVWVLVLRGNYRQVEKVFLVLCTFYLALHRRRDTCQARLASCHQEPGGAQLSI